MSEPRTVAPGTGGAGEVREPGAPVPDTTGRQRRTAGRVAAADRLRPWWGVTLPAAWGALLLVSLSLTPSLLPRDGPVQGVVSGITAALGHALGLAVAAGWRAFADRDARPARRAAWWGLALGGGVLLLVALVLGRRWQGQLRALMGVPGEPLWRWLLWPVVALVVYAVLIAVCRTVYVLAGRTGRLLSRWMGRRAARALGALTVGAAVLLLVTDVGVNAFVTTADNAFSLADGTTPDGVRRPDSAQRSGGPGSLVDWDELGREGRVFVDRGPSRADIAAFTGGPSPEPLRAYAGLGSSDDVEERARVAVAELDRTGGFRRDRLLVATTTGSGWLDGNWMSAFEYLSGGDSAIVSMQYSYLPSPLSYLFDQTRARAAGRELFDAVYERWSALPPEDRPELYVFGESLGSFGAEAAFSGEHDLRNRLSGAVFVGPPEFNVLYGEFRDDRDPGSPAVEPVYRDGRTVRFSTDPDTGAPPRGEPWSGTRVLYVQHASDPVSVWTPDLLVERPDWLAEPPQADVLEEMVWLPLVTFWQVTLDMPFAADAPPGHGHHYSAEAVDSWVTVLRPIGWTDADSDRLEHHLRN
ncbi:alpha/beta hydrolase [Blastococcus haudaquaticus]|uniref:alpha/beta hydrolase n=1 Tax=Blastococcus haudaquaticus TaxID=1938745 RepID=UPI001F2B74DC|nr:alpha/beta hydrolase [Blastococcus haudaquaticus]